MDNQTRIGFPIRKFNKRSNRISAKKQSDAGDQVDDDDTKGTTSESEFVVSSEQSTSESESYELDEGELLSTSRGGNRTSEKRKTIRSVKDDGNEEHFAKRIRQFKASEELNGLDKGTSGSPDHLHNINDDYRVSKSTWNKLYKYQKTGVRWLLELHSQYVGGILADEMGLGKTIQLCVFLRSVAESQHESRIFRCKGLGPTLIICPATLLHQWVRELNKWFPLCKVAVLHSSGAYSGPKTRLIQRMGEHRNEGSVLVTTYSTYVLESIEFLKVHWHYVILDEGHKIRNPEAKELRTPHRVVLSGSPMQNNLRELWSLIDFIYPGRLGSLKEFIEKFSIPITQGGYANATAIQVRTAFKCACVLREAINDYILRRMKKDVQMALQLPGKTEQILFCEITSEQRHLYKEYLNSKACEEIVLGKSVPFVGLMHLRKLCNHPDLVTGGPNRFEEYDTTERPEMEYGALNRSGKMMVVQSLLRLWFEQGQKVLLFSQSRQMLTIIERFILLEGYEYLRMDGTTPIGIRQSLVEAFNGEKSVFIFLLTTRVGGLGINLTAANRVVIYDPDWNPSTDTQARERAWRIGQDRHVTIYRLLSSGTIEEKIYQRQIFKHFLTNRVLVDPKQQRFFKTNDLHELFTLGSSKSDKKHGTETAAIFSSSEMKVGRKKIGQQKKELSDSLRDLEEGDGSEEEGCELSEAAKQRLQKLAKQLALNFDKNAPAKKKPEVLFDGQHEVPLLKRQIEAAPENDEGNDFDQAKISKQQDDYVLSKLLRKTNVHSALLHDKIVKDGSTADIQLIEDEANAVAKRASDVLKRARRVHREFLESASEFGALAPKTTKTPLFGRKRASGFASSPQTKKQSPDDEREEREKHFDGAGLLMRGKTADRTSGADLLLQIRQRKENQLAVDAADDDDSEIQDYPSLSSQLGRVVPFGDKYEKLAEEIRSFLAVNNGKISTSQILQRFQQSIGPTESHVFRSILYNLCDKLPNHQWALKDEFA